MLSSFLINKFIEAVDERAVSPHGQAVISFVICAWGGTAFLINQYDLMVLFSYREEENKLLILYSQRGSFAASL